MNKQGVFLRAIAQGSEEAVIDIVGVIGWEVAYQQLRDMLRGIPDSIKRVVFDIYSPGGDVWEGNGIVQEIGELSKRAETVARVQVAASMATLIAVACNKRLMAQNGRFLIHNAWTATVGDAEEHEKVAKELRATEEEAAKFYADRTGQAVESIRALMDEERWMLPQEALDLGFVTELCDPFKPDEFASVRAEIEAAGKWPKALVDLPQIETPPAEGAQKEAQNAEVEHGTQEGIEPENDTQPVAVEPTAAGDAAPESAEYARGYAAGREDGIAVGRSEAERDIDDRVRKLTKSLESMTQLASKHQGERDKALAEIQTEKAQYEKRIALLQAELENAAARIREHVAGSLTFSPTIETWEDAMRECGQVYEKAAQRFPELLKQYRAAKRQERR